MSISAAPIFPVSELVHSPVQPEVSSQKLEQDLRLVIEGEVRFDNGTRAIYAARMLRIIARSRSVSSFQSPCTM